MMRIRKRSVRTNGEETKDEDDEEQETGHDLQSAVVPNCPTGSAIIKAHRHHGSRNEEEKDNGSDDSMGEDHAMVLR